MTEADRAPINDMFVCMCTNELYDWMPIQSASDAHRQSVVATLAVGSLPISRVIQWQIEMIRNGRAKILWVLVNAKRESEHLSVCPFFVLL